MATKFMFFLLLFGILLCLLYFSNNEEVIVIEINSDTMILERSIEHKIRNVKTVKWYAKGMVNDTIILNGSKVPPSGFKYESDVNEYYGYPPIKISYDRYKATDVSIIIKYVFRN